MSIDFSDQDLLSRVRNGDTAAFGDLYAHHTAAAHRAARRIVGDPDLAQDLVSESFARVFRSLRGEHGPQGDLFPYLLVTMRNVAATWGRDSARSTPVGDDLAFQPRDARDVVPGVDEVPVDNLNKSLTSSAFATLPTRWRTVLWYLEVEGESAAEVGRRLGLSDVAVRQLAKRAREGLREAYLAAYLGADRLVGGHIPTADLVQMARGKMSLRRRRAVEPHLDSCAQCTRLLFEAAEEDSSLRVLALPFYLALAYALVHFGRSLRAHAVRASKAAQSAHVGLAAGGVATVAAVAVLAVVAPRLGSHHHGGSSAAAGLGGSFSSGPATGRAGNAGSGSGALGGGAGGANAPASVPAGSTAQGLPGATTGAAASSAGSEPGVGAAGGIPSAGGVGSGTAGGSTGSGGTSPATGPTPSALSTVGAKSAITHNSASSSHGPTIGSPTSNPTASNGPTATHSPTAIGNPTATTSATQTPSPTHKRTSTPTPAPTPDRTTTPTHTATPSPTRAPTSTSPVPLVGGSVASTDGEYCVSATVAGFVRLARCDSASQRWTFADPGTIRSADNTCLTIGAPLPATSRLSTSLALALRATPCVASDNSSFRAQQWHRGSVNSLGKGTNPHMIVSSEAGRADICLDAAGGHRVGSPVIAAPCTSTRTGINDELWIF